MPDARVIVPLRVGFGVLPLIAVGRQWLIHAGLGFSTANFFSYFTNLANIFAGSMLLLGAWTARRVRGGRVYEMLRALAAVSMLVVGLVFTVLLRKVDLGSLRPWVNVTLHYVMPCIVVADWFAWPPSRVLSTRDLAWCMAAPSAYLAYVLIRGARVGWYPYPFLDPRVVGGYGLVAAYAMGIAGVFLAGTAVLSRVVRIYRP